MIPAAPPRPLSGLERVTLAAIVCLGVLLRLWTVSQYPLWVDEAESSINALSIQEHGVPTSTYLGLPVFENTLVRPWPGHPEYEFRDISYSDKGLAVYHGWLPLYSIAAFQWLSGVRSGQTNPHAESDQLRRTIAPRVPSVLFAALSLLGLFGAARRLFGIDAGWAAVTTAAFLVAHSWPTSQARYYSATLAMHALAAWMLARAVQDGRRISYLGLAGALVLLFHSHLLSFAVVCVLCAMVLPWQVRRQPGIAGNLAVLGVLTAAGSIPWLLLTGFLSHTAHIPPGRSLVAFPDDLLRYLWLQNAYLAVYVLGWFAVLLLIRRRATNLRLATILKERGRAVVLLHAWLATAGALFVLLMPAASFFLDRLSITVMTPALLMLSVWIAAMMRLLVPSRAALMSGLAGLGFALAAGSNVWTPFAHAVPLEWVTVRAALREIAARQGESGVRFYATPNDHLTLTYYSGVPVQSIAAVRNSFLDTYPGRIVVLDSRPPTWWPSQPRQKDLRTAEENLQVSIELEMAQSRAEALAITSEVDTPSPRCLRTSDMKQLLAERRAMLDEGLWLASNSNPLFHGFKLESFADWWQVFFYRFVDPARRTGRNLNYAGRMSRGRAVLVPGWIVFESGAPPVSMPPQDARTRPLSIE